MTNQFLDKYHLDELLNKHGKTQVYQGYKNGANEPILAAALIGKKDFSIILSLQEELNKKGFNNFRSFDNNQPGWPLYTPHIVCDAYTLEAIVGFYDQFVKPEDRGELDITVCDNSELDQLTGDNRNISKSLFYPENSSDDYVTNANDFQVKAQAFLEKHQVMAFLRQYGEPEVYGSCALGLMNRPDIDTVLVVSKKDFSIAVDIQRKLQAQGFTNFWVFDNTRGGSAEDPKHIIVDAYKDEWEMGITICNEDEAKDVLAMTRQIQQAVAEDPSVKDIILRLKHEVAKKYGVRHFPSRLVYQAVLDSHAQTVEDFEEYIKGKEF